MKSVTKLIIFSALAILWSCLKHPDEDRFDAVIGEINYKDVEIVIDHGTFEVIDNQIVSNVQVPNPILNIQSDNTDTVELQFVFHNMRQDILPTIIPNRGEAQIDSEPKTIRYNLTLLPQEEITIQLQNFPETNQYKFGVVGDIQYEWENGEHIAESIKDKDLDFFIHLGDIVNFGQEDEYKEAAELMQKFSVPVYHVVGNHDVSAFGPGFKLFSQFFGKTNYSFSFNSDLFVMIDAADQGISRDVFEFAENTFNTTEGENKFFFQHTPPFDDAGIRNNSFSSNFEAARYMNMMIDNQVDVVFSGHVHSFQEFNISGVKNIIAGLGGGIPEKLDNEGYGYLVVTRNNSGFNVDRIDLEQ